ncbi:27449_t:CDS:2, partial [Racocetra persica]
MSKEGTYKKFNTIDAAKLGIHTLSEITELYIPIVTKDTESAINKILNYKDDYEDVKSIYDKLTNEFETCMKDLHFEVMIVNEVQRRKDNKKVKDDLEKMNK